MSEQSESREEKLDRAVVPGRLSRRWRRRIIVGAAVAVIAGAAAVTATVRFRHPSIAFDCARAARDATDDIAVLVCQREYEDTRDPDTGALLANALRRSGNRDGAISLANNLLATSARSDAFYVLGKIAASDQKFDRAMDALSNARDLHLKEGRDAKVALDDQAMAELHTQAGRFADALRVLDECQEKAKAAQDSQMEGHCHLAAARVLTTVGYFAGATEALNRVKDLWPEDSTAKRDLAWLWFEQGNLAQDFDRGPGNPAQLNSAVAAFERALGYAKEAQLTTLILWIELNLVYSLAELGQTKPNRINEAEHHYKTATQLDLDREYESELMQLKARIEYRRGNLSLASSLNEQVFPKIPAGDDDRLEVCVMQARIAIQQNDLTGAERWARYAIADAEEIRAKQSVLELRPWVLASRRKPYELLFKVLVQKTRFEEAISVLDQWQGRTLLDAMSRPRLAPSLGLADTAIKLQSMGQWLPLASAAPLATKEDRAVVTALRTSDLLALAVAEHDVWRVTATGGQIQIANLGQYESLQALFTGFEASPTDPAVAERLGELLIPDEVLRNKTTLHVVLDAPFVSMPITALRRGGTLLVDVRPILRLPRLPAGGACAFPGAAGGATVLADPGGDLPDARRESSEVASRFNTTALVGTAATSSALLTARSQPLLHVALHASVDKATSGGVLKLYDREVPALEIAAAQLGPSLVVLSACSSALSGDPELAGSLPTAFLTSGSSYVVATVRDVHDTAALAITSRFYAEGGTKDPVRTLAKIQAQLAQSGNKEWPSFAVFARDACTPGA